MDTLFIGEFFKRYVFQWPLEFNSFSSSD